MFFFVLLFLCFIQFGLEASFHVCIEPCIERTDKSTSVLVISKNVCEFDASNLKSFFEENDFLAHRNVWSMVKRANPGIYTMAEYEQKQLHGMEHNAKQSAQNGVANVSKKFAAVLVADELLKAPAFMISTEHPFFDFWVFLHPERAQLFFEQIKSLPREKDIVVHCIAAQKKVMDPENPFFGTTKIVCHLEQTQKLRLELHELYKKSWAESQEKILVGYIPCKNLYGDLQPLPFDIAQKIQGYLS